MPVFEFEREGKRFQIEAPDQQRAVQAFQQGTPAAESKASPGMFEQMGAPAALDTFNDATTGAGSGLSFGFKDELMAGMASPFRVGYNAVMGGDKGKSIGERFSGAYDTELANQRRIQQEAEKRSLIATTVGEVAGGLTTGGQLAKGGASLLNVGKATYPRLIAAGAGEGAAYGGAYGMGTGEGGSDRLRKAVQGAGIGAVTGGVLGAVGARGAQKAADKALPDAAGWQAAKRKAYKDVDNSGAVYSQKSVDDLASRIDMKATGMNVSASRHPKVVSMIEDIKKRPGVNPSLTELDQLRQVVRRDLMGRGADDADIAFGEMIIDELDDFIAKAGPQDMIAGSPQIAAGAITKARAANSTWRKAETIEDALVRAERQAARSGSGGNIDNAIRQQIDTILRNPKRARFFSKDELAQMDKIVRGGNMQNFARWVGKMSPEGNGLSLLLHGLIGGPAAMATGGTSALLQAPLAVGGFIAKRAADAATPRNVEVLSRLIRSQGVGAQPQLTGSRRALIEALTRQSGQAPASIQ